MKTIELQDRTFFKRFICSLFPNLSAAVMNLVVLIVFSVLFYRVFTLDLNYRDSGFWLYLIIALPLPFYLIVAKPYLESKIYITRIEIDELKGEMEIDFLLRNKRKNAVLRLSEVEYNIFNSYKISLSDRIILYVNHRVFLTQYSNSSWSLDRMNELAGTLDELGVKRPRGYNKRRTKT